MSNETQYPILIERDDILSDALVNLSKEGEKAYFTLTGKTNGLGANELIEYLGSVFYKKYLVNKNFKNKDLNTFVKKLENLDFDQLSINAQSITSAIIKLGTFLKEALKGSSENDNIKFEPDGVYVNGVKKDFSCFFNAEAEKAYNERNGKEFKNLGLEIFTSVLNANILISDSPLERLTKETFKKSFSLFKECSNKFDALIDIAKRLELFEVQEKISQRKEQMTNNIREVFSDPQLTNEEIIQKIEDKIKDEQDFLNSPENKNIRHLYTLYFNHTIDKSPEEKREIRKNISVYFTYSQNVDSATKHCDIASSLTHSSEIKESYLIVKNRLIAEKSTVEKYINSSTSLSPNKFKAITVTSAQNCSQAYEQHIINNPKCQSIPEKIRILGFAIFNSLANLGELLFGKTDRMQKSIALQEHNNFSAIANLSIFTTQSTRIERKPQSLTDNLSLTDHSNLADNHEKSRISVLANLNIFTTLPANVERKPQALSEESLAKSRNVTDEVPAVRWGFNR